MLNDPRLPQRKTRLSTLAALTNVGPKLGYVADAKGKRLADFSPQELDAYGAYCVRDTLICAELAHQQLPEIPESEQRLLDLVVKRFTRPTIRLETDHLKAYLATLAARKRALLEKAQGISPEVLRSRDQFADALRNAGVEPPTKESPATGKTTYAFAKSDKEFTDLLEHPNAEVAALVAARLGHASSLAETRTQRLLDVAKTGGCEAFGVPTLWWGAHTGRNSGWDKLNLYNLPKRAGDKELRKSLTAQPGYKLVVCDLSQIELRMTAFLAGQHDLLARFRSGEDPYISFAMELYNVADEQSVTKRQRDVAKFAMLGLQYGMGASKFHFVLRQFISDVTLDDVARIVKLYRQKYIDIVKLWQTAETWLQWMHDDPSGVDKSYGPLAFRKEEMILPSGMRVMYPNLRRTTDGWELKRPGDMKRVLPSNLRRTTSGWEFCYGKDVTRTYGPKLVENAVQALARIVMTDAELRVYDRFNLRAVHSVYDELIYMVREEHAEKFGVYLRAEMAQPVAWAPGMAVDAEASIGDNYGDLIKL
jgi:DNA polymerase I-like protein with 3'-5' exonuclease and polymerase domains